MLFRALESTVRPSLVPEKVNYWQEAEQCTLAGLGLCQAHKSAHRTARDGSCFEHPLGFRMLLLPA